MSDLTSVQLKFYGNVQGVFFRNYTAAKAAELCVSGFVRNLPDGRTVEVMAEGEREKLEELIYCLKEGPPGATVEKIDISWSDYSDKYQSFIIKR